MLAVLVRWGDSVVLAVVGSVVLGCGESSRLNPAVALAFTGLLRCWWFSLASTILKGFARGVRPDVLYQYSGFKGA